MTSAECVPLILCVCNIFCDNTRSTFSDVLLHPGVCLMLLLNSSFVDAYVSTVADFTKMGLDILDLYQTACVQF